MTGTHATRLIGHCPACTRPALEQAVHLARLEDAGLVVVAVAEPTSRPRQIVLYRCHEQRNGVGPSC